MVISHHCLFSFFLSSLSFTFPSFLSSCLPFFLSSLFTYFVFTPPMIINILFLISLLLLLIPLVSFYQKKKKKGFVALSEKEERKMEEGRSFHRLESRNLVSFPQHPHDSLQGLIALKVTSLWWIYRAGWSWREELMAELLLLSSQLITAPSALYTYHEILTIEVAYYLYTHD